MNGPRSPTPRELLLHAEHELSLGHFWKAGRISKRAGKLIDETQMLHRRFMELIKKALERIEVMESLGYDVTEAREMVDRSKERALRTDYVGAINRVQGIKKALERATYLPFPLLNKTVDIITTSFWTSGGMQYEVEIHNPSLKPLGEIIFRPFFPEGMFREVPEKVFGMIGPMKNSDRAVFLLVPTQNGPSGELERDPSIVRKTVLSSRQGKATISITIENNSDQIIRDFQITPYPPGGLEPVPDRAMIDHVEPFGSRTVTFDLRPMRLEPVELVEDHEVRPPKEKVVIVDEAKAPKDTPPPPRIIPEVEWDSDHEDAETWDMDDQDRGQVAEVPVEKVQGRDFTPISEEYDLMLMSGYAYPDSVPVGTDRPKRVRWSQSGSKEENE